MKNEITTFLFMRESRILSLEKSVFQAWRGTLLSTTQGEDQIEEIQHFQHSQIEISVWIHSSDSQKVTHLIPTTQEQHHYLDFPPQDRAHRLENDMKKTKRTLDTFKWSNWYAYENNIYILNVIFIYKDTGGDKNLSTQSSSDDCGGGVMSPDDKLCEMTGLINSGRG